MAPKSKTKTHAAGRAARKHLDIGTHPIAALRDGNAGTREQGEEARAALSVSVHDFGDISGIAYNQRTGRVFTGNQRRSALAAAGATEWSVGKAAKDGADGFGWIVHPETQERFPVRIVDWPAAKEDVARYVANNPELYAQFTSAAAPDLDRLRESAGNWGALRLANMVSGLDRLAVAGKGFTRSGGDGDAGGDGGTDDGSAGAGGGAKKQDECWFYVEFYGDKARFDRLLALLVGALKGAHELLPDAFEAMVVKAHGSAKGK